MKVIITDCDHENIDIEKKIFSDAGISCELKNARTEDEIIELCKGAEIFIVQYAKITEKVMEALPELKFVVRYGVGVDTVDVKAATKHGIQIGNVPDYGMNEVADQALALTLAFARKIITMNEYTKIVKWDYSKSIPVHRLSQQTVGIVGIGRIGGNYAKKAAALGFNIIGYDPLFVQTKDNTYVTPVAFDELIEKSDIISIHCPSDGNKYLFNKEIFKKMKKSAVLINVARGGIVNEKDLDEALKHGEIAGAGLDCMESEPMRSDSEIFKNKNLIVTPHMAWYSEESALELKRKVAEESVRFAKGKPIHYPINNLK
ncbi:C-terminal binding protein [Clostridium psychrophilum]|uniref:C-terminal binding protein n=1 Tax=Clostridium psychrophilum TaxID=132926 RepID=UPI001C0E76D8|nr:C-terminal binding protein [Clostridium psychrophilum]MBU3182511.1 C-terminal binding protein [Clostridium psychrophilum]